MYTITTKVSDDINTRLEVLAKTIDRNKSYLVKKAIESFLDEREDYFVALHRLEQKNPRISLQELCQE
ncbi:MAG: anti-toxin [Sphingobacteriaceae bacterium]|nr:MAG: anti-toxin [Sphingobacteriaceae bacterium]